MLGNSFQTIMLAMKLLRKPMNSRLRIFARNLSHETQVRLAKLTALSCKVIVFRYVVSLYPDGGPSECSLEFGLTPFASLTHPLSKWLIPRLTQWPTITALGPENSLQSFLLPSSSFPFIPLLLFISPPHTPQPFLLPPDKRLTLPHTPKPAKLKA